MIWSRDYSTLWSPRKRLLPDIRRCQSFCPKMAARANDAHHHHPRRANPRAVLSTARSHPRRVDLSRWLRLVAATEMAMTMTTMTRNDGINVVNRVNETHQRMTNHQSGHRESRSPTDLATLALLQHQAPRHVVQDLHPPTHHLRATMTTACSKKRLRRAERV